MVGVVQLVQAGHVRGDLPDGDGVGLAAPIGGVALAPATARTLVPDVDGHVHQEPRLGVPGVQPARVRQRPVTKCVLGGNMDRTRRAVPVRDGAVVGTAAIAPRDGGLGEEPRLVLVAAKPDVLAARGREGPRGGADQHLRLDSVEVDAGPNAKRLLAALHGTLHPLLRRH